MADGSRHSLAFIPEVTYGVTPNTPVFQKLRNTKVTLGLSKTTKQSAEIRADRQISDYRHGARQVGGDIEIELSYGTFDVLLEAILGGTWTADTPVAGTSQLKAGTTRRSFTMERYFSDIADYPYHRFTGVEMDKLRLDVKADDMITGAFSCIGKDLSVNAAIVTGATYTAETTTSPLDSYSGILSEGGVAIAVVTEIQLNIDNGMATRFVVGSRTTLRPSQGRSNVTGTVTAYFDDSTMLNKFINETESSIEFTLPDAAGNSLKFRLPRVKYGAAPPDVSGEGPITLAMPFQALLDPVTGSNILIERNPA